ncbi:MAG TPA: hypothetical protein ENO28_13105 [Bacteroidetes bacterium]|nr:hypothetical protein [Bacteroidota bacterium]
MINKNHYLSVYKCLLFCLALGSASLISCKKNKDIPKEDPKPLTTETGLKIYKPKDMANMDWNSEESQFCYARSKQSDHYIIFWSKEYGKVNPSDASVPDKYRVDIDAMLSKAEGFYQMNVNQLKFADLSLSTSNLHKYKMMIFLYHQDDWLATGSGYDDVIGSLWVSPAA